MSFIATIQARNAEITATIAALVAERDENDAALRVFARFGFDTGLLAYPYVAADGTDMSGDVRGPSNSAASTQELPRPMEGAADSGEVRPGLAASYEPEQGTVSSGDFQREPASVPLVSEHLAEADAQRSTARPNPEHAPVAMGEADAVGLMASADLSHVGDDGSQAEPDAADERAGEVGPETVGASPAQSSTGKPVGPSGSAAPSLADRLRALHAEHPEYTVQQAALALGETFERVRNNSNVNKIKWDREAARSIGLQDRVAEVHREHPDGGDAEIAAAIGKSNGYVRATAQRLGIVLPSRKRPAPVAEAEPVEADPPAEAPEPAPEPESPPASTPEPANDAQDNRAATAGKRFWLVNDAGLFLNRFGTGFTADRRNAWDGNEKQLAGIRRSYLIARDLREKPVTKEQPAPINREVA